MRVLVSGANGFVGQAVCRAFLATGASVTGLVRRAGSCITGVEEWVHAQADFVDLEPVWPAAANYDVVIHLASRVHVLDGKAVDSLAAFRATNVTGTLRIAQAAMQAKVPRFVFVSSVKALGETEPGHPWREADASIAQDPYGISKYEAEQALTQLVRETNMELVIVRPPLVYGPEVQANFLQLLHALARKIPLPLASSQAKRSMVFVDNLADALLCCASHPKAAGEIFHVADDLILPMPELLRLLAQQLDRSAYLFKVPFGILQFCARLLGRTAQVERLFTSLRLDTTHVHALLEWTAPYSATEGLAKTAAWYRATYLTSKR